MDCYFKNFIELATLSPSPCSCSNNQKVIKQLSLKFSAFKRDITNIVDTLLQEELDLEEEIGFFGFEFEAELTIILLKIIIVIIISEIATFDTIIFFFFKF